MPRPKTKKELLHLACSNFESLFSYIDSFPESNQEKEFEGGTMNRNIRDVLSHLYHWHILFLKWYEVGMKGEKPFMPSEGYTWKTTADLNKWILEKYKETRLSEAKKLLTQSHSQMMSIIDIHSNEELFTKKKYPWTGSTSLGAYLISSTSSHYAWALKLIKKATK